MKKKFLLLSGLVLSTCTVLQAQNYAVGGSVKAWHNHQDGITSFSVAPDIGYTLSDKWYIGTALGGGVVPEIAVESILKRSIR